MGPFPLLGGAREVCDVIVLCESVQIPVRTIKYTPRRACPCKFPPHHTAIPKCAYAMGHSESPSFGLRSLFSHAQTQQCTPDSAADTLGLARIHNDGENIYNAHAYTLSLIQLEPMEVISKTY